jgi:predicted Zn-dependent protease
MFRRLMIFARQCAHGLLAAPYRVRGLLIDWFYVLTAPIRAFRPRVWIGHLFAGVMEVLMMLRLARPRGFSSELASGGLEAVGMFRSVINGAVSTVVGFFSLLIWLPWFLARFCYYAPIEAWYFLRSRSRWQLVYITAAAVIVLVGSVGTTAYLIRENRRTFRLTLLQRQYDDYLLRANDLERLEASLVDLAAELPNDEGVAGRLEMVRRREALASEPNLVRFFMRYHMARGQVDDSVREANRLLETEPNDWEAQCYLARAALSRGDVKKAKEIIARLPRAEEASGTILRYPIIALESTSLFLQAGDAVRFDEMIDFITIKILPELRAKDIVNNSVPYKFFLINCYYLCLSRLDKRPALTKYWAPLEVACQSILDDPAVDAQTLVQLGEITHKAGLEMLNVFRRQRLVTEDEYAAMTRDLLTRQQALWQKAMLIGPKLPGAYIGMAEFQYTIGAPDAAEQALVRGLAACGPVLELVVAGGKLLGLTDPNRGLKFLDQSVKNEDMTPAMCSVVEEVATRAGRPDRALEVCRLALKQDPKQDWFRLREAVHCLTYHRPAEAVAALRPIEDHLVKYPDGCADYVRALSESGSPARADEFLDKITAGDCPVDVLLKTAAGLQAAHRNADALRWARRGLDREPRNVAALLAVADNSRILADRADKGWDIDLVRESLRAYRTAEQQRPEGEVADRIANNIAWLELKALRLPQEAYVSAARLRAIEERVDTKAEYLETLGAIYIGVGRYEQAKTVLIQAIRTAPRGSFYTYMALACHGLRQLDRAESYLDKAGRLPMTPSQQADLREAKQIIRGH